MDTQQQILKELRRQRHQRGEVGLLKLGLFIFLSFWLPLVALYFHFRH